MQSSTTTCQLNLHKYMEDFGWISQDKLWFLKEYLLHTGEPRIHFLHLRLRNSCRSVRSWVAGRLYFKGTASSYQLLPS
ncbi:hypothetical protein GIB67_009801 [Kingdonia uniflora]|uniref:Uncharacterized protein n=1 Tax=Kingdonia uniflora TaxID=39325 RepID=A0A7J7LXQ5_9MAGN|nr:hypothetical protein GIB67_009801 [Kingdonia uniflora]